MLAAMLLFIWICAALALVLWSLASWGLHVLLTADPAWVDDIGRLAERVPFGEWIERWVPGWRELLRGLLDLTHAVLGWAADYAGWVVGVAWGLGALAVLAVAAALTLIVVLVRDRKPKKATKA